MSSVDNRVVEMTFNNAEFERKMSDTMKSLDGLKKSLDFSESVKHLGNLEKATSNFNLKGMADNIESVSAKFLALSTIGVTALATIVSKAVNAGITVVKSLTLDPILSGFSEYEGNINAIQTILANTESKGSTLDDVTKALGQLNDYADQTIYNFGQMTKNIGTFTAAGIDLDTSVSAIKGIANLAATSGSTADQASSAMYQLSQALASGSVKLQDWNSIVNAGMGGEVFQKALFETGKALGTLKDVPLTQTFDEWKKAGHSFRTSLEDGWVSADVLTTTLQAFTGDLSEAQLTALGYTKDQAVELAKMGKTGKDAATKIKTFTQLVDTVKESVGSGWSETFRILIGDFDQAKQLFTGLSDAIGGVVKKNAEHRNAILKEFADLGGRGSIISGLVTAFKDLQKVFKPIKEAFREVFPPITAQTLLRITEGFRVLAERLVLSEAGADKIKRIFKGLFSGIQIGIEVVKNIAEAIKKFFGSLDTSKGTKIIDFFVNIADNVVALKTALVDNGGIKEFFDKLAGYIQNPIPYLLELKEKVVDFFAGKGLDVAKLEQPFDRIKQRFETIKELADKLKTAWDWVKDGLAPVLDGLQKIFDAIKDWFKELGEKLAAVMEPGDFNKALDLFNTGFLGGIVLLLKKFFDDGFKIDINNGLFKNISKSFEQLTGTLSAMQTEIKADALLKIAGAIALLTASVVVLSLIDSGALTKALTAMTVGFGQLVGSMQLLSNMDTNLTGASAMAVTAAGMIAMATAVLILTAAVAILAQMDWEEIGKGLAGVTGLMTVLVAAANLMDANIVSVVTGSAGMILMAVALNILAGAVKLFSMMSWQDLGKGMAAVAAGLAIITIAVNAMPVIGMLTAGAGLIAIGIGLTILAGAIELFSLMSWEDIGKGMAAVAAGLLIIAGAMNLMPLSMVVTSLGLLAVAVALNVMAAALMLFGSMDWGEIGRGLAGMAGSLLVLAGAMQLMSGGIPGAIALILIANGLTVMIRVIKEFAKVKVGDLIKGLIGIAAVFLVLGLAAAALEPILPALLGLGVAMLLLGAGFALFGIGVSLAAEGFTALAKAGKAGVDTLMYLIDQLLTRLPEMGKALGLALIGMGTAFIEAAPVLVKAIGVLIGHILDTIIEQTPKLVVAIIGLLKGLLKTIRDVFPDFVKTGIELLLTFLSGIKDNTEEIVKTGVGIITNFIKGLIDATPDLVTQAALLIKTFLDELAKHVGEIVAAGVNLVVQFINGISNGLVLIVDAVGNLVVKFIEELAKKETDVIQAGVQFIIDIIKGIGNGLINIVAAVYSIIKKFLDELGKRSIDIINAGFQFIVDFINGLADAIDKYAPQIRDAGIHLAWALADGFTFGLAGKAKDIAGSIPGAFGGAIDAAKTFFGINSPSKVFIGIAESVAEGFTKGLADDTSIVKSTQALASGVVNSFTNTLSAIPDALEGLAEFNPVITPVLDMTGAKTQAGQIGNIFAKQSIGATVSTDQAQRVSTETTEASQAAVEDTTNVAAREIKFEQTINSPTALSSATIYKQTRNQIELAKRELAIA